MAGINLLIGADVRQAVTELQKLNGFVNGWSGQVRGAIMGAFSFYAVYQGLKQTVGAMAEFQAEMSKLKALSGETGARLEQLRQNALGLAGAFKAIDIARAESDLSRAGFSTDEINNSIKAIIRLATATGEDLPKSAEIASATLRAFQLDSKEMQRVTDVMAGSFNKTALDLTRFGEAMKYVAPNAKAANVSLEETTAMLGILANNGIHGSMAGTALRRVFQDLSKDGRPVAERLAELGESGLTAADAMDEIGRIGSTSLLILANSTPQIKALNDELHRMNGETDRMADIMLDNLAGDWKKISAEWDKAIQKGTWLSNVLRAMTQSATDLLKSTTTGGGTMSGKSFWDAIQDALPFLDTRSKPGGASSRWGDGSEGPFPQKASNDMFTPDPSLFKKVPKRIDQFSGGWVDRQIEAMNMFGDSIIQNFKPLEEWTDLGNQADKAFMDFAFASEEAADAIALTTEAIDPETQTKIDEAVEGWKKWKEGLIDLEMTAKQKASMIRSNLVSAFSGLGRVIGNALSGSNLEATLLGFLGGIAVQVGEMAVAIGVAMLGIEAALKGLGPFGAIAAGLALIALGTYAQNRSAEIGSQVNGGGGGGGSMPRWADKDVTLTGEWRIRGSDLVYVLDKQGYRSSVVGG